MSRDSNPRDPGLFGFRAPSATLVNESGLYSLILSSRKPEAKEFKRWVTGTVLPTIRKTGMYLTPKVAKGVVERPEVFLARALVLAHDTINGLQVQAEGLTPGESTSGFRKCHLREEPNFGGELQSVSIGEGAISR